MCCILAVLYAMTQLLIGIAAVTIAFGSGWTVHGWKTDADMKQVAIAHAEKLIEKDVEHAANQDIIDSLAVAVRKSPRVRFKIKPCRTAKAADQDREARLLSERLDEGFRELQESNTARLKVCERINSEAIRAND